LVGGCCWGGWMGGWVKGMVLCMCGKTQICMI
jgi:hypothetical protein